MNKATSAVETADAKATPAPVAAARSEKPRPLEGRHMPKDLSISLASYRRGGTDKFLAKAPDHLVRQPMRGFEPHYVNIVDYIVRITHRIWEEKDVGYIYDTYSHDSNVWDDYGLQYGRDRIVADTLHTTNAFPDIRLIADEVIWAGDEDAGFHTSHRTVILGTNTGYSKYGAPTGKPVRLWCIANCVARDNEIFYEHVLYNTSSMVRQMGFDLFETARRMVEQNATSAFPANFAASEPRRLPGQGKPPILEFPGEGRFDVRAFAEAFYQNVWNRRMMGTLEKVCAPGIVLQGPTERVYRGVGRYKSFVLSMLAMFPDLSIGVDDIYWMGNDDDGYLVSVRWSAQGTHRGHGLYGPPTGRETHIWGITQWAIKNGRIENEWTMFNELGVLMQLVA
jgi:predicted ester cyclase